MKYSTLRIRAFDAPNRLPRSNQAPPPPRTRFSKEEPATGACLMPESNPQTAPHQEPPLAWSGPPNRIRESAIFEALVCFPSKFPLRPTSQLHGCFWNPHGHPHGRRVPNRPNKYTDGRVFLDGAPFSTPPCRKPPSEASLPRSDGNGPPLGPSASLRAGQKATHRPR